MPIMDRKQYIEDRVKSIVGFPVITNLDSNIQQIDYDSSILRYYQATPITHIKVHPINTFNNEVLIDIATLLDSEFPPTPKTNIAVGTGNGSLLAFKILITVPVRASSIVIYQGATQVATDDGLGTISGSDAGNVISGNINYSTGSLDIAFTTAPIAARAYTVNYLLDNSFFFYLGIINSDFRSNLTPQYNLNRYLLGVDIGFDQYAQLNPFKRAAMITTDHQLSGTTQFEYRMHEGTKGVIHIISRGVGNCTVHHGFGYSDVDKLPFNHLETFTNLVAESFLTRLISIRSMVDLPGDYKINTNFIQNKLDQLIPKNEQALIEIASSSVLWDG